MDKQDKKMIISSLLGAGMLVGSMWLLHFLTWMFDFQRGLLGTFPRSWPGLVGIITSPFMHADLEHIALNSGPLFVFYAFILYFYRRASAPATVLIWLLTGLWVWIYSKPGISVIGASGLVYGFGAFLFFSGMFRREVVSITVSLFVVIAYGSMVWGIFPGQPGVSWESHLFGLIAGAVVAWYFRKIGKRPQKRYKWQDEPEKSPEDAHADWNYQENWQGSGTIIIPGHEELPPKAGE
jgi:membrane associated rhomboid family serine protease